MAQLTRLGIGGVGATYEVILDKDAANEPVSPAILLTRLGIGGVGRYFVVANKAEEVVVALSTSPLDAGNDMFAAIKQDDDDVIELVQILLRSGILDA